MIISLTEAALLNSASTFWQVFLHGGENVLGIVLRWLGAFLLDRLEFTAQYPANALTGLALNVLIGWFLVHARSRVPFRRGVTQRT